MTNYNNEKRAKSGEGVTGEGVTILCLQFGGGFSCSADHCKIGNHIRLVPNILKVMTIRPSPPPQPTPIGCNNLSMLAGLCFILHSCYICCRLLFYRSFPGGLKGKPSSWWIERNFKGWAGGCWLRHATSQPKTFTIIVGRDTRSTATYSVT